MWPEKPRSLTATERVGALRRSLRSRNGFGAQIRNAIVFDERSVREPTQDARPIQRSRDPV